MRVLSALLVAGMSFQAMAKENPRLANPAMFSKEDREEQKKRFKLQVEKEKEQERLHREVYKTWDDETKDADPWTNWHRKKIVPALLQLSKIRKQLYSGNLFDSYFKEKRPVDPNFNCSDYDKKVRRVDGRCNDLNDKLMGASWTRFGRNIDLKASVTDESKLMFPDPRKISRVFLTRDKFKPVPFLNLMAVGWIQFMTHDWFSHGKNEATGAYLLPLSEDDPLGAQNLIFPRSMEDKTRTADEAGLMAKTFLNEVTHWWDGSQVYGSEVGKARKLYDENGLMIMDGKELLPTNPMGVAETGFNTNWWIGLEMLHTLFAMEHNAIAKHLKSKYPNWTGKQLYDKARMINAALMAKIHTIEWTPAILPNRTLRTAMNANWKGLANTTHQAHPWFEFFDQDILFGIVGGKMDRANTPFHMTEEFVSVYRMHSLLPDTLDFKTTKGKGLGTYGLHDVREAKSSQLMRKMKLKDIFYSFGQMKPGAMVANNFPKTLQNIDIPIAGAMDLGAMDIFRDRERGIPRYNEFRRQMGLKELTSWDQLTPDKEVVAKLRKLYFDDLELLDLLPGTLAEGYRPVGYGFGETAFQVFIVMASRRLVADRFYTTDYNAKTYTKEGIKWVDDNSMKTVLLRHFPELKESLHGVRNAFNPWNK